MHIFLHFYPFRWNYTKYHPVNVSNLNSNSSNHTTASSPIDTELDSLILNSCGSTIGSLITEIGLFPLNTSSTAAQFVSTEFKTQRNCLLQAVNLAEREYFIGILSYHDGFTANGAYNLSMTCIDSFQFPIKDALECQGIGLGTTTPTDTSHYYAVTLKEKQNKTIFNTCGSDFDNSLTLWLWNETSNNWTTNSNHTCNNCGNCGTSTIMSQSQLEAGNYYLQIGGVSDIIDGLENFGKYLIEMYCSDEPPGYPVVGDIECGGSRQGTSRASYDFFSYDGFVSIDHYSFNYYSFQIADNVTSYTFNYKIAEENAYLQVYKWNGEKWTIDRECKGDHDDKVDPGCTSTGLTNDAQAGNYYLAILIASGDYEVYMECKSNLHQTSEDTIYPRYVIYSLIGFMCVVVIVAGCICI